MEVAMTVDQLDMIEEQQKQQHEALTLGFRYTAPAESNQLS